jgi:hypothetical protein
LEGHIYIDVDGNHFFSPADIKLPGQKVLWSGAGASGEVLTDVEGKYQIINLEP